ncbi:hypothetical protein RBA41_07120 [Massilia sp. CCM 9210]|uniref:hypothetical protein n=1 Tax=Massilia scottii TaxID=3057166 RepID=UPI002796951F|nr:hypothetical protein [Massilia sp. CCM 9210]MDQ1813074.1 hypothetical protein [Massilia sp. CCM 9210]
MSITKDKGSSGHLAALEPPAFAVSKIKRTHSLWRYLWPFQSLKQFLVFCALSLFIFLGCTLLARLWPDVVPLQSGSGAFILGLLIWGPCMTLPARMTIITRGTARQFIPRLEQLLQEDDYTISALTTNKDRIYFRFKWPSYLAWLHSPEQDLELSRICENDIELHGPARALYSLEMSLRWELEK